VQPRLLLRTHYQVEEPAYIEFLIMRCTSATEGAYAENIARRLSEQIRSRCRIRFNVAAGRYAVDLARALGLLTPTNTWTPRGHLVNLISTVDGGEPEEQLALNPAERLLHFLLFLEHDGAAIVLIARYLLACGVLSHAEAVRTPFIEQMFDEILSAYLAMTSDTVERLGIRKQIERLRQNGYAEKTRQHKLHIHMQVLYRLGLVDRVDSADGILYRLSDSADRGEGGLEVLLSEIPDVATLETRIRAQEWPTVASRVFGIQNAAPVEAGDAELDSLIPQLAALYQRVMAQGTPLCPLSSIIEGVQILALIERLWLVQYDDLLELIRKEQKEAPREIRFHVDRRGMPAYVRFSEAWLNTTARC
jgi:hypothetical protein